MRFAFGVPEKRPGSRVLVAVEPHVLADALAGVLAGSGDDVVVLEPESSPTSVAGDYDVAVVTIVLPDDVHAEVIIELPDDAGGRGTGTVREGGASRSVRIDSLADLLELLP